ncbi:MAG: DUF4330 domain-containing protein [Clostridia bacterium]|nr:DUF4330 domain-containing protein [Clostridia bacterium]
MTGRKVRFNAIDAVILLILAAAVGVLLYIFVFSKDTAQATEGNTRTIQYVVEIANIDEHFADDAKAGQPVQEAVKRKRIGTVVGVQTYPYEKNTFSYDTGRTTVASAEGRITMKITIEANVTETDRAFTADGCEIRVGEQYSLMLPGMYGVGFCTDIIK